MKLESLRDLYIDQLQDLYSAEEQLTSALPRMAESAAHPELKAALNDHLQETHQHLERLQRVLADVADVRTGQEGGASGVMERIYSALGRSPAGKKCPAMAGLIQEGEEIVKARADGDVRDAGLIAAVQRIEHYEIAAYGTVCTYAEMLDRGTDHQALGHTLAEEKAADTRLNEVAKQIVNVDATVARAS